jgi:thiol-disulfide isomerase/thioredoxin
MIKEKDLKEINTENLRIFLINGDGSREIFSRFEKFLNELKKELPLKIENKHEKIPIYPAIKLTDREEKVQIYYMAVPEGLELNPFLNTLKTIPKAESVLNKEEVEKIKDIKNPVEVKIFITSFCPFCPAVVEKANQLAIFQNSIRVFIIDAMLHSDLAQKYKVTASPTVIINEDFVLVGNEARTNLVDFIKKAGEAIVYDKEVLKNLLKQGEADRVIELCEKDERCLYSLVELLKAEELFTRIGVMRVFEEMAEKREIPAKILFQLIEMFKNADNERDKDDILYLLSLIGTPEIISEIEKAIENESPIIKEVGQEAIEKIRKREKFH